MGICLNQDSETNDHLFLIRTVKLMAICLKQDIESNGHLSKSEHLVSWLFVLIQTMSLMAICLNPDS
jgi:hypothetical protein